MEITLSRKTIANVIGSLLLTLVLFGGYFAWKQGMLDRWLTAPETSHLVPADEPAIESLMVMYSPAGERAEWEKHVCAGTTEKGCEMFHSIFADPIWKSAVDKKIVTAAFIETVDVLEDGSLIWKTEVSDGEAISPIYIHVIQNESGRWLLNRVLFLQETEKYQSE